jgi:protein kinase A
MPSLGGFLKKRRTRESKAEPSPSSQPTSPITPVVSTSAKPFNAPLAPTTTQDSTSSAVSHTGPSSGNQSADQAAQTPASAGADHPMSTIMSHAQSIPPYGMQHTPSPGQAGTPQNLPSINNLINPPQLDGSAAPHETSNGKAAPTSTGPNQHGAPPSTDVRVTKGKYSLNDFEMLRTLGTGSFGRVHLVQSKHNQRYYAVKVLKKAQVVKMKQVEHTNDERRMLGEVKHPFLITLWGTFQDARNLYMVMDFVEGGELFSLLRKSGVGHAFIQSGLVEVLTTTSDSRTQWRNFMRQR